MGCIISSNVYIKVIFCITKTTLNAKKVKLCNYKENSSTSSDWGLVKKKNNFMSCEILSESAQMGIAFKSHIEQNFRLLLPSSAFLIILGHNVFGYILLRDSLHSFSFSRPFNWLQITLKFTPNFNTNLLHHLSSASILVKRTSVIIAHCVLHLFHNCKCFCFVVMSDTVIFFH